MPLLVKVIEAHGEDFDEMNVATAFHEIAKVAKGNSKEELEEMHLHETFQNLVGRLSIKLLPSFIIIPHSLCIFLQCPLP